MRHITMPEFVHYLILFGSQAAIWVPLMNLTQNSLPMTLVGWFVISVVIDKLLHKYMHLD